MKSSFNDLNISLPIKKAIEEMGFESPTDVQSKVIPHLLNHKDLIVISKTGSGKTAAFGVPILEMTNPEEAGPQALILTPTRELAVQVDSDLLKISKHLKHKVIAVYGQHSINVEILALKKGATVVTGTPGRLYDHIRQGNINTKNVRFLVLDEADRMLDMGFIDQVVQIIKTLPKERVTLLFSATIPSEIQHICKKYMKDPLSIELESQTKTVDSIHQIYHRVNKNEKRSQLNRLLLVEQPESCMIFCNTRYAVDQVQDYLSKKGYSSQSLHGDIAQGRRTKTIQQFKDGEFHLLVATDVAARGIHIDNLSLVINYDVPNEKSSYVHRIGRTGRAGSGGRAITLASSEDIMSLYEIEEYIGAMIAEEDLPSDDVFNERSATAYEWIHAKSQNLTKWPSPIDKFKDRGARGVGAKGAGTNGRMAKGSGTNSSGASGRVAKVHTHNADSTKAPESRTSKTVKTPSHPQVKHHNAKPHGVVEPLKNTMKPIRSYSTGSDVAHTAPITKPMKKREPEISNPKKAIKQSLKSLIKQVFGKK